MELEIKIVIAYDLKVMRWFNRYGYNDNVFFLTLLLAVCVHFLRIHWAYDFFLSVTCFDKKYTVTDV